MSSIFPLLEPIQTKVEPSVFRPSEPLSASSIPSINSSITANTLPEKPSKTEILIYNVSHADMLLGFDEDIDSRVPRIKKTIDSKSTILSYLRLAKPNFSEYAALSNALLKKLKASSGSSDIVQFHTKQGELCPVGLKLGTCVFYHKL